MTFTKILTFKRFIFSNTLF